MWFDQLEPFFDSSSGSALDVVAGGRKNCGVTVVTLCGYFTTEARSVECIPTPCVFLRGDALLDGALYAQQVLFCLSLSQAIFALRTGTHPNKHDTHLHTHIYRHKGAGSC